MKLSVVLWVAVQIFGLTVAAAQPQPVDRTQWAPDPDLNQLPANVKNAYEGGQYTLAARIGATLLAQQSDNPPLRLIVANSLAQTGRFDAAIEQFRRLIGSQVDRAARLGLATVTAWQGGVAVAEAVRPTGPVVVGPVQVGPTGHATESPPVYESTESAQDLNSTLDWQAAPLEVIRQVSKSLAQDPSQIEKRLTLAHALAKISRKDAAITQYQKLYGTRLEVAARIGVGNLLRAQGLPEAAEEAFKAALAKDPASLEALAGQQKTTRELRPRIDSQLQLVSQQDRLSRKVSYSTYSTYTDDRAYRWGLGYGYGQDHELGFVQERALQLQGFFQWLNQPSRPKLELTVSNYTKKTRLFGLVSFEIPETGIHLRAGLIDWGRLALTGTARVDGLFARWINFSLGARLASTTIQGRLDFYSISDSNRLWDVGLNVVPDWQPLPDGMSWYAGLSAKRAERSDPRYWSPVSTQTLGLLGLKRDWFFERGNLSVGVEAAGRLTEETKNSLSLSATGKYWFTDSTAIAFDLYGTSPGRNTELRSRTLNLFLQRIW